MRTKKSGLTARYGPRYGRTIREAVKTIEERQRRKHRCPKCGKESLKRVGTGIWQCRKCGAKIAGGAYVPSTEIGRLTARAIATGEKGAVLIEEIEKISEHEKKEKPKEAGE
jgi:large subunit ribosomal protein L37Ae